MINLKLKRALKLAREARELAVVEQLVRDAGELGVTLTEADAARLIELIDELGRWNELYNLTGITTQPQMITHHLLDSLAVNAELAGQRVADVGTGAGFPGLPLALANPQRHFTLIDSTAKKLRFVAHAVELLRLKNVSVLHARVEKMHPPEPFDTVVARAFAPLPRLLETIAPLCGPGTRVLAMKGKWPQAELAALPCAWRVVAARELTVPGLDAARCVITLGRAL
jgi:16S rRNA (guanine527-N7)-methyltransferase